MTLSLRESSTGKRFCSHAAITDITTTRHCREGCLYTIKRGACHPGELALRRSCQKDITGPQGSGLDVLYSARPAFTAAPELRIRDRCSFASSHQNYPVPGTRPSHPSP